jgi:hypothetical protein
VLRIEGGVLSGCSNLLDIWSLPEGNERQKTPLFMKLFAVPHMLLLIPWRLTFDVVGDVAEFFAEEKPVYIPSAIQELIMEPGALALDFYLDGNLDYYYFNTHKPLDDDEVWQFTSAWRSWMEDVMRSKGKSLQSNQVAKHLWEMITEGYI